MPTWLNIALTFFYVLWLCAVLLFLWFIWRNGEQRTQRLEQSLIDSALKSAEAAKIAAEAARAAVEHKGSHLTP